MIKDLKIDSETEAKKKIVVDLNKIQDGMNVTEDFFIKKKCQISWVVSRVCDHNSGKMVLKKNSKIAVCPLHGWELNLENLRYKNINIQKRKHSFEIKKNKLIVKTNKKKFFTPTNKIIENEKVKIRYLSHASILISYAGINLLTDPWFFGPAFQTGWWLKRGVTLEIKELLPLVNYIYISHNHPDHLHLETLSKFDKNINIITPKFQSGSTVKLLKRAGFKNIFQCDFKKYFSIKDRSFIFTVLKSGDFRDDSGLYLQINNKKILLNVDSNYLNSDVLPENIDVLLTSFAGGASGFPLCFLNYSNRDKKLILVRNKNVMLERVYRLVKLTKPKYLIPYAGHFSENAKRDFYILKNNKKNTIDEVKNLLSKKKILTKIIDVEKKDTLIIDKNKYLVQDNYQVDKSSNIYNENLIIENKQLIKNLDHDKIIKDYFVNSNFASNLILTLRTCDDNFENILNNYYFDFSKNPINYRKISNLKLDKLKKIKNNNKKYLEIYARIDSLLHTIKNKLPFEDLLIGFQLRIFREPNFYNTDFWYHFTNVYIDGAYFKFNEPCNSCEKLNQQIF